MDIISLEKKEEGYEFINLSFDQLYEACKEVCKEIKIEMCKESVLKIKPLTKEISGIMNTTESDKIIFNVKVYQKKNYIKLKLYGYTRNSDESLLTDKMNEFFTRLRDELLTKFNYVFIPEKSQLRSVINIGQMLIQSIVGILTGGALVVVFFTIFSLIDVNGIAINIVLIISYIIWIIAFGYKGLRSEEEEAKEEENEMLKKL